MTHQELESLVNDLCLIHMGWMTDEEAKILRAAKDRIYEHGFAVRKLKMVEILKSQIAVLEQKE